MEDYKQYAKKSEQNQQEVNAAIQFVDGLNYSGDFTEYLAKEQAANITKGYNQNNETVFADAIQSCSFAVDPNIRVPRLLNSKKTNLLQVLYNEIAKTDDFKNALTAALSGSNTSTSTTSGSAGTSASTVTPTTGTSSSPSGTITAATTSTTSKKNYLPLIFAACVGCLLIIGSTKSKKKKKK